MNKNLLYYIASPYTHPEKDIMRQRYEETSKLTARLMKDGFLVYNPIAYGHPIATANADIGLGWEAWERLDLTMIQRMDALIVHMLPCWQESQGIAKEVEYARNIGRSVFYTVRGNEFSEELDND